MAKDDRGMNQEGELRRSVCKEVILEGKKRNREIVNSVRVCEVWQCGTCDVRRCILLN